MLLKPRASPWGRLYVTITLKEEGRATAASALSGLILQPILTQGDALGFNSAPFQGFLSAVRFCTHRL